MTIAVFIQNRDFFGARLIHLPLLYGLRKAFQDARLVVYAPMSAGRLFRELDLADEVRVYRYSPWRMLKDLRRLAPHLILSLRPASQWLNLVIGMSGAPRRVGYRTPVSRIFFTDTVDRDVTVYRALNFLDLLKPLGLTPGSGEVFRYLAVRADSGVEMEKPYFIFVPAGSDSRKQWGIDKFLELSRRMRQNRPGAVSVFVLGPKEGCALKMLRNLDGDSGLRLMVDETIPRLARVMEGAEAVIAQDCAPGHIAQMLQVPFVGLFHNRDGRARDRMGEWFHRRERAEVLIGEPGRGIDEIPVDRVEKAVERICLE